MLFQKAEEDEESERSQAGFVWVLTHTVCDPTRSWKCTTPGETGGTATRGLGAWTHCASQQQAFRAHAHLHSTLSCGDQARFRL